MNDDHRSFLDDRSHGFRPGGGVKACIGTSSRHGQEDGEERNR